MATTEALQCKEPVGRAQEGPACIGKVLHAVVAGVGKGFFVPAVGEQVFGTRVEGSEMKACAYRMQTDSLCISSAGG